MLRNSEGEIELPGLLRMREEWLSSVVLGLLGMEPYWIGCEMGEKKMRERDGEWWRVTAVVFRVEQWG